MRSHFVFALLLTSAALAACGGGSYSAPTVTAPASTPAPTSAPTATATPTTAPATTLSEASLLGSPGFVAPATNHTVYVLSGDTTTHLECTVVSGCTGVWPPVGPPIGVALSTGFTVATRPDNGAQQLAYQGNLLYTYTGDSASGTANGNGIVSFGGTWSVARP